MLACLSGLFVRKLHRRDLAVRYALGSVQLFCIWVLLLGADFAFWFNRHFLATANLLDQLETLVLGRFFQQDLWYRNHCCASPLANASRWNDIRSFGRRTWRK